MSTAQRLFNEAQRGIISEDISSFRPRRKGAFKKFFKKAGMLTPIGATAIGINKFRKNKGKRQENRLKRIEGRKAIRAARKSKPGYQPTEEVEQILETKEAVNESIGNIQPVENSTIPTTYEEDYENNSYPDDYQQEEIETNTEETESFTGIVPTSSKQVIIILVVVILVIFFVFKNKS